MTLHEGGGSRQRPAQVGRCSCVAVRPLDALFSPTSDLVAMATNFFLIAAYCRTLHPPVVHLGHRADGVQLTGCSDDVIRDYGVYPFRSDARHHGFRARTLLRASMRHHPLLLDDLRHGNEAKPGVMHLAASGPGREPITVLRGPIHQNQPDITDLQPRGQGHGETTELHKSALAARHQSVSRVGASARLSRLVANGAARNRLRLSGPTDGDSALPELQRRHCH